MADGDIMRLTARWQDAGNNTVVNTFHFQQVGATAGDPLATLAGDFLSTQATAYKLPVSSTWLFNLIRVEDVVPGTAASYELVVSPAQAGSTVGDALPPQDSAVLAVKTALKGRSFQGRNYMPPTGESTQAAGAWISAYLTNVEAFAASMFGRYITNAATSHFRWVVVSRYSGGVKRAVPIATAVLNTAARPTAKTLRRRQLGVGV